jgi:hypothetical protein
MPAQSLARHFYDQAVAGGAAFLRQLVTDKTPETEWLVFKGGERLNPTQIQSNWSETLSGFANNEGGVLVWGIDARRNRDTEVDVACDLKLVPDPERLRDRLRQLHPVATDPPLIGVESAAIFDVGTSGAGYVVSFVPQSDVKPHRAEHVAGKPYVLRIGDRFVNPSPAILRNLFFPRSSARLGISVHPVWQGIDVTHLSLVPLREMEVLYRASIYNDGIVTAKDVFVIAETTPASLGIEVPYRATKTGTSSGIGTGIEYTLPLHPSSIHPLCVIRRQVESTIRTSGNAKFLVPSPTTLAASFQIFAADMKPLMLKVTVTDFALDQMQQVCAGPVGEDVSETSA